MGRDKPLSPLPAALGLRLVNARRFPAVPLVAPRGRGLGLCGIGNPSVVLVSFEVFFVRHVIVRLALDPSPALPWCRTLDA